MKKFLVIILIISFLFVPLLFLYEKKSRKEVTLNVYNWGDFISLGNDGNVDVNSVFTQKTGIKINYTTFQSNEEMLAKILGGGASYDVIFPSDYVVARLKKEEMLERINFDNIPNYKLIDSSLTGMDFDPRNEYSVPYLWGILGIFYNKQFVKDEISWDLLWDKKYGKKILMFDNPRDALSIALLRRNKSVNSHDLNDWEVASKDLNFQRPLVQNYMSDQIFDKLIGEEAYLAPYYCGHSTNQNLLKDNKNLEFKVPREGTNRFVDCVCILKKSKHKREAEEYINFLCREDISLINAKATGYIPANENISKKLLKESEILKSYDMSRAYTYNDIPSEISKINDDSWIKIKSGEEDSALYSSILILIFLFLIITYAVILTKKIRKIHEFV